MSEQILTKPAAQPAPPAVVTRPSVDDMGVWSFPASDPPATWTWDVDLPPDD